MVKFMQLECTVQLTDSPAQMKEYGTGYGDGRAECYIAAPEKATKFFIRLNTKGYIATGLAMWVFIDGNLQCNRVRRNIHVPRKGVNPMLYEVNFIVRGKEMFGEDDFFTIQDWSFQGQGDGAAGQAESGNTKRATALGMNPFEDPIGTIRVVILRCALTKDEKDWVDPFGAFANVDGIKGKLRKGKLNTPFYNFLAEEDYDMLDPVEKRSMPGNWLPGLDLPLGIGISARPDTTGFSGNRLWVAPDPKNDPPLFPGLPKLDDAKPKASAKGPKPALQLPPEAAHLEGLPVAKDPFFLSLMAERVRYQAEQKGKGAQEPQDKQHEKPEKGSGQVGKHEKTESTHRMKVGPKYRFCNALRTPKYLDTGEQPYVTFIFRYRSKSTLKNCLGIPFHEEEKRERYEGMTKDELIARLMKLNEDPAANNDTWNASPAAANNDTRDASPAAANNDTWSATPLVDTSADWNRPSQNEKQDRTWGDNNDWVDTGNADRPWGNNDANQSQNNNDQWNDAAGVGDSSGNNDAFQEKGNDKAWAGGAGGGGNWDSPSQSPEPPLGGDIGGGRYWNFPNKRPAPPAGGDKAWGGDAGGGVNWDSPDKSPAPPSGGDNGLPGAPPNDGAWTGATHGRVESMARSDWAMNAMDKARRRSRPSYKADDGAVGWANEQQGADTTWGGAGNDRHGQGNADAALNAQGNDRNSPLEGCYSPPKNDRANADVSRKSPPRDGNWTSRTPPQRSAPPPQWRGGNGGGGQSSWNKTPPLGISPLPEEGGPPGMRHLKSTAETGNDDAWNEREGGWAGRDEDKAPGKQYLLPPAKPNW